MHFFHSQVLLSELGWFGLGLDELGLELETLDDLLVRLLLIGLVEGAILRDRLLLKCPVDLVTSFFHLRLEQSKVKEKSGRLLLRRLRLLDLLIRYCRRNLTRILIDNTEMILFAL